MIALGAVIVAVLMALNDEPGWAVVALLVGLMAA